MLTAREFSQHLVSSSKTVRPNIPRGARCVGHCEIMWSAVCSLAPHSQFGKGARPHLYMDEPKRPTPERRRLSLTQEALGRLMPIGLVLTLGMKSWSPEILSEYSMFHLAFVHWATRVPIVDRLSSSFRAAGTNGCLDLSLFLSALCGPTRQPCRIWSGSRELRLARERVAPWRRSSAGWMPESTGRYSVGVGSRHPETMRNASLSTLSMRRVCALRHQTGAQYSAVE